MKKQILFALVLFMSRAIFGTIIYVPANQPTIQAGIDSAAAGDSVIVADGTYFENINFKGKAVTVASHYIVDQDTSHISKTIIDGSTATNPDSTSSVLFISGEDTTSVLAGFTIRGGSGTKFLGSGNQVFFVGGGIFCHRSGAKIVKNIIAGNSIQTSNDQAEGGGIDVEPGDQDVFVIIKDNLFKDNHVESKNNWAGGGALALYANCLVRDNIIKNNSAKGEPGGGGAMCLGLAESFSVFNNVIDSNLSSSSTHKLAYAAVLLYDGMAKIVDNKITHNNTVSKENAYGSGIFMNKAHAGTEILNNDISGNKFNLNGSLLSKAIFLFKSTDVLVASNTISSNKNVGGIHADQTSAIIRGNTVTDNVAYYATGISGVVATVLIENNYIARNLGQTGSGGGWLMSMESALLQNNLYYENDAGTAAAGGLAISIIQSDQSVQCDDSSFPARFRSNRIQKMQKNSSLFIPDFGAVVLFNNTIVDNKAFNYGGGLFIRNWKVFAANNIIWGNTAGTDGAQIWDPMSDLTIQNSAVQDGWSGVDMLDTDPLFEEDSFELSIYSPCIGAGTASMGVNGQTVTCCNVDYNSSMRPNPAGSNPDIGAFEHERSVPAEDTTGLDLINLAPFHYQLKQNYPNPFNPATTIEYRLSRPGHVIVTIYNLSGQYVRKVVDENQSSGVHRQSWDATDDAGAKVSSGVYLYRIQVFEKEGRKAFDATRKMLLLK